MTTRVLTEISDEDRDSPGNPLQVLTEISICANVDPVAVLRAASCL